MSVDYNMKSRKVATGSSKSKGFPSSTSYPVDRKNNNKDTGFVVRGGGSHPSAGLDGLHKTKVSRPVDTGYMKHNQVTKGGGNTSIKNVHGNPVVSPEC